MPPVTSIPFLVSTDWLGVRLGTPDVRVVDGSWYVPGSGRDARGEYLAGHLPGALFYDLDASSDRGSTLPHMLPAAEAFADRAYTPAGALVSRRDKGAVLHDAALIAERMLRLVSEGVVEAIDGSLVRIQTDSICVHGDSPGAVAIARQVRERFEQAGVTLTSFVEKSES